MFYSSRHLKAFVIFKRAGNSPKQGKECGSGVFLHALLLLLCRRQEYSRNESFACEGRRYKAVHNVGELNEDMETPECLGQSTQ